MAKPYVEYNTQKRIEAEKNGYKDGSVLQINEQCCVWKKQWKT